MITHYITFLLIQSINQQHFLLYITLQKKFDIHHLIGSPTLYLTLAVGVAIECPRQRYSGIHVFETTELAISVSCEENFQESDCSQFVPGFTGEQCQTTSSYNIGVILGVIFAIIILIAIMAMVVVVVVVQLRWRLMF